MTCGFSCLQNSCFPLSLFPNSINTSSLAFPFLSLLPSLLLFGLSSLIFICKGLQDKEIRTNMLKDLPDCFYPNQPITVRPSGPTPKHSIYLSNLDDQKFLRFSIKYLYLFKKSVSFDILKSSLSRVLVDYYPLAGRLRKTSADDDSKLELDCNAQGALFAQAFMDITADEFLQSFKSPNESWRKLLYKLQALTFMEVPPLSVQVTNLRCGGMILCTAINHCVCDGIGTSQFLQAWAHVTTKPNIDVPISPFHGRHVLKPRSPPQVNFPPPGFTKNTATNTQVDLVKLLKSRPLSPTSFTFNSSDILRLKKQCVPSLKCTTFEALAAHTWRSWVGSLDLSFALQVKLLFSVNIRKKLSPKLPEGYYGNGFVLGCAESTVKDLVTANLYHGVKLMQNAKEMLDDERVRSMVDLLEDKTVQIDLSRSLVISQWSKLGLEELDFGEGKPLHMGSLTSDIYCLFLPVIGDSTAVRVQVSVPESLVEKFEYYMQEL